MQRAGADAAPGQRHVDRFGREPLIQERVGECLAARIQRGFDLAFHDVDARAFGLARVRIELAEALQQLGERSRLAEKACLLVFERSGVGGGFKSALRVGDNLVQVH